MWWIPKPFIVSFCNIHCSKLHSNLLQLYFTLRRKYILVYFRRAKKCIIKEQCRSIYWRFIIVIKILAIPEVVFTRFLLDLRKQQPRMSPLLAQGHTVSKWQTISPFLQRLSIYHINYYRTAEGQKWLFLSHGSILCHSLWKIFSHVFSTQSHKE